VRRKGFFAKVCWFDFYVNLRGFKTKWLCHTLVILTISLLRLKTKKYKPEETLFCSVESIFSLLKRTIRTTVSLTWPTKVIILMIEESSIVFSFIRFHSSKLYFKANMCQSSQTKLSISIEDNFRATTITTSG